jgi:AraC-like DNA-binding protein
MAGRGPAERPAVACAPQSFRAADLDRARAELCRVYYPLRIDLAGTTAPFELNMRTVSFGSLVLGRLTYAAAIRKDCGDLQTAFHVNVPVQGQVRSSCGGQQVIATPETAAVFNPLGRTILDRWQAGTTQLCLKISRAHLERELAEQLGRPLRQPLAFQIGMSLTSPAGRDWLHALRMVAGELDSPGGFATQPLLAAELRRLIVAGLLWCQPHSYTEELASPGPPSGPRTVKTAVDLIESVPERPWTASELAAAAGASVRSLEDGFRRHVGVSPMAYLRQCRLERVHAELREATGPGTTVGAVAYRWGFAHLGRFARAYRSRYGENPSDTLYRAQP